jgi:hypothetical protein
MLLAIAVLVLLEPALAIAAPSPAQCLRLRKIFDACEGYQIQHNKPVFPRCSQQWQTLKKAGCA